MPSPEKSATSGSRKTSRARKDSGPQGGPTARVDVPTGSVRNLPNTVTDSNKRSGNDVLMGHFATVTEGEHQGRLVVTEQPVSFDKNGWPKDVQVITRDAANERLVVPYDALAPAKANRQ